MESEYLGIPIDPQAKGDIRGNASCSILHTSPHMKPQTYNGDEDWESYLNHFELCAELGRWSYQDRVLYLAASFRGNAQVYYMTLMPAERSSYHTLVVKLGLRFSNNRQQPMWISRLEARVRRQNESIAELGDDLCRMSQRVYSSLNNEAKEMLALNQIYKSVSPELKYKCISKNCTSVTQAVSIKNYMKLFLEKTHPRIWSVKPLQSQTGIRRLRKVSATVETTIIFKASSDNFKTV